MEGSSKQSDTKFQTDGFHSNRYGGGSRNRRVPIAICGMGMRLPGGIRDATALYDFLESKGDARTYTESSRFNIDGFRGSGGKGEVAEYGYWLHDVDLTKVDESMFNFSAAEIGRVDPLQRLLLEVVWEALENAGESGWRGKDIGCYVGTFGEDWMNLHQLDSQDIDKLDSSGQMDWALSNRLSYEFDFRGPSMTIKTACSAAGLGVHLACQAIEQEDCSSAIIAGTNLILSPRNSISLSELQAVSSDSSSKSFDASANGYARAEGVNAIFIKRLDAAIADGNPIRAIIRGTSTNSDGRSQGLLSPSQDAHERLIRKAYERAGLDVTETALVECHSTGTATGDPVEVGAVAKVFGQDGVYIGAVKPNLGHSEGASAITSIMKSVLSLESATILPNIKFHSPNPKIPFEEAKLTVPIDAMPWPQNRCERISVNTFGIGGTNAHVILDSAASFGIDTISSHAHDVRESHDRLLVFSASHPESLSQLVENYASYLEKHPDRIDDLELTLLDHRERLQYRKYVITDGTGPFEGSAQHKAQGANHVVFVFSGQGAQWPQMGRALMAQYDCFEDDIDKMDAYLQGLDTAPCWKIKDEILKLQGESLLERAEYSQPACTAIQVALVNLLAKWNVFPSSVIGHSSGEIAAAYAAGALDMQEAILVAYLRGQACKKQTKAGGMAAVGLGKNEVHAFLRPGVAIACENSGSNVTLSGEMHHLEAVMADIQAQKPCVFVRKLRVEMAYHSDHMREIGKMYAESLRPHLHPKQPSVPFYSTVTAALLDSGDLFGPEYWRNNLESPVLFYPAIKSFFTDNHHFLLEIGPHGALGGPLRQIFQDMCVPLRYASTITRGQSDIKSFLKAIGDMFSNGVPVRRSKNGIRARVLTDLPRYPWRYGESHWHETRLTRQFRLRQTPAHEILGLRILEGNDLEPTWRAVINLHNVPWLRDHRIFRDAVFPAAGYICMAGEAAHQIRGAFDYTVKQVVFHSALVLSEGTTTEVITTLRQQHPGTKESLDWYEFTISSWNGLSWTRNCSGLVRSGSARLHPISDVQQHSRKLDTEKCYQALSRIGMNYGPAFACLERITAGVTETVSAAVVSDAQGADKPIYPIHPTTLDAAFHSILVAMAKGLPRLINRPSLPTSVSELYVGISSGKTIDMNSKVVQGQSNDEIGSLQGVAGDHVVLSVSGLTLSPVEWEDANASKDKRSLSYLEWKPDLDFLNAGTLIRSLLKNPDDGKSRDILYLLCSIEAQENLRTITPAQPFLAKYYDWMRTHIQEVRGSEHPLFERFKPLLWLSSGERQSMIRSIAEKGPNSPASKEIAAVFRCYMHMRDIFEGRTDVLQVLRRDNLLTDIYDGMNDVWDYKDFFTALGHLHPQMNILEVGSGTGGLTAKVLKDLKSDFGERLYHQFTFTDVSSGFFPAAKQRFKEYSNVDYRVFDISKDHLQQGFKEQDYDLIIASNVLHATPSIKKTLGHLRTLLRPNGRLFLQELSSVSKAMNFIMGLFPGWWLGADDDRLKEPYINQQQWQDRLTEAGFAGIDSFVEDLEQPFGQNITIISRPMRPAVSTGKITLLYKYRLSDIVRQTWASFRSLGYEVELSMWGEPIPRNQDLISFIDLEEPFFHGIKEQDLEQFLLIIKSLHDFNVLWLTRPSQTRVKDPRFAQSLGVARTIRSELSMNLMTLELEDDDGTADAITRVFHESRTGKERTPNLAMDKEFLWMDGKVHMGRFHWTPISTALTSTVTIPNPDSIAVKPSTPSLSFKRGSSYILVGGLGGIGKSVATWMAMHGARNLVFLSRSAGITEQDTTFFDELAELGVSVQVFSCDVGNARAVQEAIDEVRTPIAGVIQLAMVLCDKAVLEMDITSWNKAVDPKVQGTWNLHNLLPKDLDFFVLFGSISGQLGYWGQSNYASANSFLNAFADFRHSLGLPASIIELGAVEDVGSVSESPELLERLKRSIGQTFTEQDVLDSLQVAINSSAPTPHHGSLAYRKNDIVSGLSIISSVSDVSGAQMWTRDARMAIHRNLYDMESVNDDDDNALAQFLLDIKRNPKTLSQQSSRDFLAGEIRLQLSQLLMKEQDSIDTSATLSSLGLDSLMAIEIRNWMKQTLGSDISVLGLLAGANILHLADLALKQLQERYGGELNGTTHPYKQLANGNKHASKDSSNGPNEERHRRVWKIVDKYMARLDAQLSDLPSHSNEVPVVSGRVVLLTGSTGSFGCYLLDQLLRSSGIHKVYALNRGTYSMHRQLKSFYGRGLDVPADLALRVEFLECNLAVPRLGLATEKYTELQQCVDTIIHNAWESNYSLEMEGFENPHITGLSTLIELGASGPRKAHFHFISSLLAVMPLGSQGNMVQEAIQSTLENVAELGYAESKYIGEQICSGASKRHGFPTTIHRVSQIAGSKIHEGQWNKQEWLPSLIRTSVTIKRIPNTLSQSLVDWVPVDIAAKGILEILEYRAANGSPCEVFHIANPAATTWDALLPAIRDEYDVEPVDFHTWLNSLEQITGSASKQIENIPSLKFMNNLFVLLRRAPEGIIRIDTTRSESVSATIRTMAPITPDLMNKWIKEWRF